MERDDFRRQYLRQPLSNPVSTPQFGTAEERRSYLRDRFQADRGVRGIGVLEEPDPLEGSRAGNAFMGAARGLASALEPLQLIADAFQGAVVGAIDPETTIMDRLRRMDLPAYMPGGRAPVRPATGYEFMELIGVENEGAKKFGGAVFDIFADPWIAIPFLKVAGMATKSVQLVKFADKMDRALSLGGLNRAMDSIPAKQWLNHRVNDVMDTFMNAPAFWSRGGFESGDFLTYGDWIMSRTSALNRQFKSTMVRNDVGEWVRIDPKTGAEVENFGTRLFKGMATSRQTARNVSDRGRDLLLEAQQAILGDDAVPFLKRAQEILSGGSRRASRSLNAIPADMRDGMFSLGYDLADNLGWSVANPKAASALDDVPELVEAFGGMGRRTYPQQTLINLTHEKVAAMATRNGFDPREAIKRFDTFVQKIIEADAMLGFHLSGYDHVKKLFMRRMNQMNFDQVTASGMWTDMVQAGMRGERFMEWEELGGVRIREWAEPRNVLNLEDKTVTTVADLLEAETIFRGLDIQDYLRNLQEGHMRRAYGLFQDPRSFKNYMANLRAGRVIPSNIIDDKHVASAFGREGPLRQAYDNYMDNLEAVKPPGPFSQPGERAARGVVVRQSSLMEGIRDQLVRQHGMTTPQANREAQGAVKKLIQELGGGTQDPNSPLAQLLNRVMEISTKYEQAPGEAVRGGFGRAMFKQREDLSREVLETLGELAMPQVSIMETARAARSQVGWTEFVNDAYQEAARRGYVRTSAARIEGVDFVHMKDSPTFVGPFADTWVHPYLKKELVRAARDRSRAGGNLARMRSLITGGYLASPNVITANLFGGVYTSALMGIGPWDMFRELGDTVREFRHASQDVKYTFRALEDLKRQISIDDTTLVTQDIEDLFRSAGITQDFTAEGIQGAFDRITGWFQKQLDAPLGQKWAGLDGFQFVENWMKVSAFKAHRRRLAFEQGIDIKWFDRPFAERPQAVQALDVAAGEAARLAVFDYSDIPESVRLLRDSGLLLFPAFPFFLTARTAKTFFERPGVLGVADRVSGALNSAQMDPETELAVWASLPEWLQQEQGVAIPWRTYKDEDGNTRRSVIPFNQLVPTATLVGNPWAESLFTGGIYKPFIEMGSAALITRDGEAPFSAKFGQRVFEEGVPAHEQIAQTFGFLMNNLAPGAVRKLGNYTPGEGWAGLLSHMSLDMEGPLADSIYSLWEIENQRAERRFWDDAVSSALRSPQVIMTEGPLANIQKNITRMQFEMGEEIRALEQRRDRALLRGATTRAQRIQVEIDQIKRRYQEQLAPMIQAVQRSQENQQ